MNLWGGKLGSSLEGEGIRARSVAGRGLPGGEGAIRGRGGGAGSIGGLPGAMRGRRDAEGGGPPDLALTLQGGKEGGERGGERIKTE